MKNPQLPNGDGATSPMQALSMAVVYGGRYQNEEAFPWEYVALCAQARRIRAEVYGTRDQNPVKHVRWPEILGKMIERETDPARLAMLHALYAELSL